jgi:ankyrin repeat protein
MASAGQKLLLAAAAAGNAAAARTLIQHDRVDVNSSNMNRTTALHVTVMIAL